MTHRAFCAGGAIGVASVGLQKIPHYISGFVIPPTEPAHGRLVNFEPSRPITDIRTRYP